ncbi:FkbM family methyltransferase [Mucilaginibacter psychrotolerans]|uniref:FkbM family methyltransferase n=1 Tax=Mucilaginibacter psychrotolerans TaxID=1524096 RepID=UPI0013050C15|nr:FkbM family methyltransferase [Mucilaginibacter psychrotolerans]
MTTDLAWAFSSGDYYEKNVIYFLDEVVKSYHQPVLIDVGANCGYFSTRYAAQCKNVFSFEPVKGTFSLLKRNFKRNGIRNAVPFNLGLSNAPGQLSINIYNSSGNNSIFERKIPKEHSLKKIGVELIKLDTLDNLIEKGVVSSPNIIKIDVEGAELLVLGGAAKTILKHRPTILMEYSENTSNDAGYAKEELLSVLMLDDYSIFGIPEDEQDLALIEQANFQTHKISNVIFVPRERKLFFG